MKFFFIPRSLKTTRNNRSSPHNGPIKKLYSPKSYYFCITNNEIIQNSKVKQKKFSFLCTLKNCTAYWFYVKSGLFLVCTVPVRMIYFKVQNCTVWRKTLPKPKVCTPWEALLPSSWRKSVCSYSVSSLIYSHTCAQSRGPQYQPNSACYEAHNPS